MTKPNPIDDLVERLRAKDAHWQGQCDKWVTQLKEIDGGAMTAEIEATMRHTDYAEAAEEIERLTAALQRIATDDCMDPWAIARAAHEGKQEQTNGRHRTQD